MKARNNKKAENELNNNHNRMADQNDLKSISVVAPIDYYGTLGRSIRHLLLDFIEVGQPILVLLQRRRSSQLTRMMRIASFFGTEDFFTIYIIFLQWCVNARLARLYTILMAMAFYVVGFCKAALCLPRPRLPLIKPLETAHDWALPSNHAMMASCLPLYVWFYSYLHAATLGLSSMHCGFICLLMCIWSSSVMLSRLYLGVHSPADIVSGGLLGCLLLSAYLQIDDALDFFVSTPGIYPVLCYLALVLLLCSIFPSTDASNPCFPESVSVFGVVLGTVSGRCLRWTSHGHLSLLEEMDHISSEYFLRAFFRMAIGATFVLAAKALCKVALKPSFIRIYSFLGLDAFSRTSLIRENKKNPVYRYAKHLHPSFAIPPVNLPTSGADSPTEILNRIQDPKFAISSKWDSDLPVSFITYGISMYLVVEGAPHLFDYIGY